MGGLSIWHWLIVLMVILLLFGTSRVGNLMGELGKGIKSFKQNVNDEPAKTQDAAMTPPSPGSLNAPLQDSIRPNSSVNQG